jgi:uncharacterized membrane protein YcaP (DUF421 family)
MSKTQKGRAVKLSLVYCINGTDHSQVIHQLLNGKETVLIKHGKIMEKNLIHLE